MEIIVKKSRRRFKEHDLKKKTQPLEPPSPGTLFNGLFSSFPHRKQATIEWWASIINILSFVCRNGWRFIECPPSQGYS